MPKVFEDEFTKSQIDMVSICFEYANYDVEKIYIYGSWENGVLFCDYFFKVNGRVLQRHHLNQIAGKNYDVSRERQSDCLDILLEDMEKIKKACKKFGQPMPTQIKLIYDVTSKKMESEYKYENQYSSVPYKLSEDIADEWFEEVKAQEEGSAQ